MPQRLMQPDWMTRAARGSETRCGPRSGRAVGLVAAHAPASSCGGARQLPAPNSFALARVPLHDAIKKNRIVRSSH
jgi:hypothetical protein